MAIAKTRSWVADLVASCTAISDFANRDGKGGRHTPRCAFGRFIALRCAPLVDAARHGSRAFPHS
jgi:hypothetical protein